MGKDKENRALLIRQGNECFNQGRLKEAIRYFLQADYKDGLARVGDHFLYERKEPVNALSFYKKAHYQKGIDLIIKKIVTTIRDYLRADECNVRWQKYIEKNFDSDALEGALEQKPQKENNPVQKAKPKITKKKGKSEEPQA